MPISTIGPASLNSGQTGSAPIYAARAWVNFNGTGTVAIRAAGNVSSITDNGTGDYTVNYTNAFQNSNFAFIATAGDTGSSALFSTSQSDTGGGNTTTTSRFRVKYQNASTTLNSDADIVSVAVFR